MRAFLDMSRRYFIQKLGTPNDDWITFRGARSLPQLVNNIHSGLKPLSVSTAAIKLVCAGHDLSIAYDIGAQTCTEEEARQYVTNGRHGEQTREGLEELFKAIFAKPV
jgi:hypothetical protein